MAFFVGLLRVPNFPPVSQLATGLFIRGHNMPNKASKFSIVRRSLVDFFRQEGITMAWVKLMLRNLYFGGRQKSQMFVSFFCASAFNSRRKAFLNTCVPVHVDLSILSVVFPAIIQKKDRNYPEKGQLHAHEEIFRNCPKCVNVVGLNNK